MGGAGEKSGMGCWSVGPVGFGSGRGHEKEAQQGRCERVIKRVTVNLDGEREVTY